MTPQTLNEWLEQCADDGTPPLRVWLDGRVTRANGEELSETEAAHVRAVRVADRIKSFPRGASRFIC